VDEDDFNEWIADVSELTDEQLEELIEVVMSERGARKDLSK